MRTYSSSRPAKTNTSPTRSRAMKPSSMVPMVPPETQATFIDASATMVPTCSLWRRPMALSGTRQRPSTSAMRWYSG